MEKEPPEPENPVGIVVIGNIKTTCTTRQKKQSDDR